MSGQGAGAPERTVKIPFFDERWQNRECRPEIEAVLRAAAFGDGREGPPPEAALDALLRVVDPSA